MITEADGCARLAKVFRARGYAIAENVPFAEGGVTFNIDGWDGRARVGYEFRTSEVGDKDDLTDAELAELAGRMERGELFVLVIDDTDVADVAELAQYAERFLDVVALRRSR